LIFRILGTDLEHGPRTSGFGITLLSFTGDVPYPKRMNRSDLRKAAGAVALAASVGSILVGMHILPREWKKRLEVARAAATLVLILA